jgi:hypothetical protein
VRERNTMTLILIATMSAAVVLIFWSSIALPMSPCIQIYQCTYFDDYVYNGRNKFSTQQDCETFRAESGNADVCVRLDGEGLRRKHPAGK